MKVNGFAAFEPKEALQPFSYETKPLAPYEILIKVSHCGLCHTDLYMINNSWKRSTYPLLPGHEIVGTVVEKGTFSTKEIGERVGAGWIHSSCLSCRECMKGDTNICMNKTSIYNQGHFGGFADFVVADSRFSYRIPEAIASPHAAPLLCAGSTVYAPLIKHKIQPGQAVAIIGIGGLGHLAIQFAKAFGCDVSALSSSPAKEKDAIKLGATHFYPLNAPPKNNSFDFILCTVDAQLNWNQILSLLRPNGILCFVSRPLDGLTFDPMLLISPQRTICGSNNANQFVMQEMLLFCAQHKIQPWIEEMPLTDINKAIEKLSQNKVRYRIVLS